MNDATWAIQDYMEEYRGEDDYSTRLKLMLSSVISSVIEISESRGDCFSEDIWSELESMAKEGGLAAVAGKLSGNKGYSISDIDPEDVSSGMNYLGQHVSTALYKHIHDLPLQQRKPEMFLRALETVMANLLNQKFDEYDQHKVLDSFCEHIHMALDDKGSWGQTSQSNNLRLVKSETMPGPDNEDIESLIVRINNQAEEILARGGETALIYALPIFKNDLVKVTRHNDQEAVEDLIYKYDGFFMVVELAQSIGLFAEGLDSERT